MAIISKICPWQLSNATPWGVQWQPYATHGKHLSKLRRKNSEPLEVPAAGDTASSFNHLEILEANGESYQALLEVQLLALCCLYLFIPIGAEHF